MPLSPFNMTGCMMARSLQDRSGHFDSFALEHLVEAALHGEARAEKAYAPHLAVDGGAAAPRLAVPRPAPWPAPLLVAGFFLSGLDFLRIAGFVAGVFLRLTLAFGLFFAAFMAPPSVCGHDFR